MMNTKILLLFCAQSLLIQGIYSQCIGSVLAAEEYALGGNAFAYGAGIGALAGYGAPYGYGAPLAAAPSSGVGFIVTSFSPITPTGITVVSENAIEGALSIIGELPFLGAVALEGALPSAGAGGINYGCGNGVVGIVSEGLAPPAIPAGFGYGAPGLVGGPYGPGFNGLGFGSRVYG